MARPVATSEGTLREFLAYLATERFAAGVGEWLKAYQLLNHRTEPLGDQRWKYSLAPIFARDAAEQQRFYNAFDLFFIGDLDPSPSTVQESSRVALPERPAVPVQSPWRKRVLWATLAAILMALLAWLVWGRPDVTTLIGTPSLPKSVELEGQTKAETPGVQTLKKLRDRTCAGLECITEGGSTWLLLGPLVLWVAYSLWGAGGVRRLRLRVRESVRTPPFQWPVRGSGKAVLRPGSFFTAMQLLRKRVTGDLHVLDVQRTLRETIRSAGCPIICFASEQRPPEYLVFIERRSRTDHFAAYVEWIFSELQREGAAIHVFRYDLDPRLSSAVKGNRPLSLRRLASEYRGARTILIGEARALLDPVSGEPAHWTGIIAEAWPDRALLTPRTEIDYGEPERRAARLFPVQSFSLERCAALVELFESPLKAGRKHAALADAYPLPPDDLLTGPQGGGVELLAVFFSPEVFRWLCACAIHTELEFDWTVALAELVAPGTALAQEENLLALARLPWFRAGRRPDAWRPELVRALDAETTERVREELIHRIERERAPKGTYAWDKQELDLAAHRYWLKPTPQRRADLETAMSAMADSDVAADAMLIEQRSAWRDRSRPGVRLQLAWARLGKPAAYLPLVLALCAYASVLVFLSRQRVMEMVDEPVSPAPKAVERPKPPEPVPPAQQPAKAPAKRPATPSASKQAAKPYELPAAQDIPPPQQETSPPELPVAFSWSAVPGLVGAPVERIPAPAEPEELKEPPTRQTYPYSDSPGAVLTIALLTSAGYPLPERTDVRIEAAGRRPFERKNVRFDRDSSGMIAISGMPDGTYTVKVDPENVDSQTNRVIVKAGTAEAMEIRVGVIIDPNQVVGVVWPEYEQLPPSLRGLLEGSQNIIGFGGGSGRRLYDDVLDSLSLDKASLLNIYAKALRTPTVDGRSVATELRQIVELRNDGLSANVGAALPTDIQKAESFGIFKPVSELLHNPPASYGKAGSWRTLDVNGSLQLTFFRRESWYGSGVFEVVMALDIDATSGLRKAVTLIKQTLAGAPTHPYEINQILLASQQIDPGYRLITNQDLWREINETKKAGTFEQKAK